MRVLLVEDDRALARGIRVALRGEGYTLDWLEDGLEAAHALRSEQFDLVLLDLGLPRLDGMTLLRQLRARSENAVPVLVLTARDAMDDRIQGLDAGADDYLVKPFALSELVARIEAILRRSQGNRRRLLEVADLAYDLDMLSVTRAGVPIKLNPLGMKLLMILMQRSPAVVRREALEEALWGDDCPDSDSLRSHIHQLRQAIDKPFASALLHTVHGVGYRLAANPDAK